MEETTIPQISFQDFMRVELRVGQITRAEKLENSNKLIKLNVSLGAELGDRQILAGIAKYYTAEQLVDRRVIVVANLAPAKLAGESSEGMVLAADSGEDVLLIEPAADIEIGSQVR